ncbi:hypothetical protein [Aneurinibacillus tyrosinisolvens]|uniref:hypothetical protein n=1 Tax=Aneurinibacillus tyrosinisolvens TaxID=1443435 RepID=UPI00063EEB13|nr:hypothetical protein [Aneurinibacillus tyrosinisolvens]
MGAYREGETVREYLAREFEGASLEEKLYADVIMSVLAAIEVRLGITMDDITYESRLEDLTQKNLLGAMALLRDIHEMYEIQVTYPQYSEYHMFPTVKDVIDYIAIEVADAKGL